jgi:hypothetical protein
MYRAMQTYVETEVQLHTYIASTLGELQTRVPLPPTKQTYPLGGSHSRSGRCEEKLCPRQQPMADFSVTNSQRSHYTEKATIFLYIMSIKHSI